ncbi:MAG: hypothetical protein ACK55I_07745, partial [bacterium]
ADPVATDAAARRRGEAGTGSTEARARPHAGAGGRPAHTAADPLGLRRRGQRGDQSRRQQQRPQA